MLKDHPHIKYDEDMKLNAGCPTIDHSQYVESLPLEYRRSGTLTPLLATGNCMECSSLS